VWATCQRDRNVSSDQGLCHPDDALIPACLPAFRCQGTVRVVNSTSVEPLFDLDHLFKPKPVVVRSVT
jgi:hypothetical protein